MNSAFDNTTIIKMGQKLTAGQYFEKLYITPV